MKIRQQFADLAIKCDALIATGLGDRVYFADDAEYGSSIKSYYSGTVQAVKPWCIVRPESSEDVSLALKALVGTSAAGNWDVAVRGGGHSHWPSNNVGNGVTIDLSLMNSTVYDEAKEVAHIGAGARWGAVFSEVEKFGRSVAGGREGNVGVAGLTLGGGASFWSSRRGFACDNVVNYEVVLADGAIVSANIKENKDLFKALKGGSSNFGIVTRFDMETFEGPIDGLWGGLVFLEYTHKDAALEQFSSFIDMNRENLDDSETMSFTWNAGSEPQIAVVAVNMAGANHTASFAPLDDIPSLIDDRKHRSYGEMIREYVSPGGPRSVWFSLCFHNDLEMLTKADQLYQAAVEEVGSLFDADSGVGLTMVVQPLAKHFVEVGAGNNMLGLDKTLEKDSILWLIQGFSATAEQEAVLYPRLASMAAQLEEYAKQREANTQWRYLSYVNPAQDPLGSYGSDNVKFLKKVAAKYDPEEVFQKRVAGGFKISRVQ